LYIPLRHFEVRVFINKHLTFHNSRANNFERWVALLATDTQETDVCECCRGKESGRKNTISLVFVVARKSKHTQQASKMVNSFGKQKIDTELEAATICPSIRRMRDFARCLLSAMNKSNNSEQSASARWEQNELALCNFFVSPLVARGRHLRAADFNEHAPNGN